MSKTYVSLNVLEIYKKDARSLADAIELFLYEQGEYSNLPADKTLPCFLQALHTESRYEMAKYIEKALFTNERENVIQYLKETRTELEKKRELITNSYSLSKKIQKLDTLIKATEYFRHAYELKTNGSIFDILISEMKKEYLHRVGPQFDNAIIEMEKLAKRLEPEAERLKDAIRNEAADELFDRICNSGLAFRYSKDGPGMCIELADIENIAERMKNNEPEIILAEEVDDHDR